MQYMMEEFSKKVASAIDGGLIPWRLSRFPVNVISRKPYGAINPILLSIADARFKHSTPWWGTYAQWQTLGCRVQRPDVLDWGARIVLYKCNTRSKMEERRLVRDCVYNWEQTDQARQPPDIQQPAATEGDFQAILTKARIKIEYVFTSECKYYWDDDSIRMPHRCMFELGPGGIAGYYDALGHELFHWSERRMRWNASLDVCELRAEIGTGYLGALLGAKPLPRNLARHHDQHADRWSRLLRANPEMLFDVVSSVTDTLDFLLHFTGRQRPEWQLNAHNVVPFGPGG